MIYMMSSTRPFSMRTTKLKKKHDLITGRPKQWFSFSGTTASYEKQALHSFI